MRITNRKIIATIEQESRSRFTWVKVIRPHVIVAIRICVLAVAISGASTPVYADDRFYRCAWNAMFEFVARNRLDPPLASRLYAAFAIGSGEIFRRAALELGTEQAARVVPNLLLGLAKKQTSRGLLWAPYPITTTSCATSEVDVGRDMLAVLEDTTSRLDGLWKRNDAIFRAPSPSGQWHPDQGSDPLRPDWGYLPALVVGDVRKFQSKNPVSYGSLDRQAELVWNAVSNLSPRNRALVLYWADGAGTLTPPGHWAQIALDEVDATDLDLDEKFFIVAATMIAINDAVIACWRDKYAFGVARPSQILSKIETVIPNPNFPAYPSGHSVISSAASHVLAFYIPKLADRVELMAQRAGQSRFLGGIHYLSDIDAGAAQGKAVATEVVRKLDPAQSLIEQITLP
ncbi:phosphatase PAP2 family protein [Neomesorhizobium albiziae]|nr:phosphatase PAP2 family protein [Mesorhizobium albiziae]